MNYVVISEWGTVDFEVAVKEALDAGYQLEGGVSIAWNPDPNADYRVLYAQAVSKKGDDDV